MKTIKTLSLAFVATILFACTATDPFTPIENSFAINGTEYETPNAYVILDDGPQFKDGFIIALANAPLIQNGTNGAAAATAMTQAAVLFVKNSPNTVANEQLVLINPTSHTLNTADTEILTNVSVFGNTFLNNGNMYGEPSHVNANVYEISTAGNGTVTINNITIDYSARTGTIDCTYQMTASTGETITGNYSGTFGILSGY
ncbi:MAG: hypothetical protein K2Y30_12265 [Flavobacteriaceae bacterium]|uniref:Lipoprotein n=1 Tax=Flavobacterium kayseriense TaxID=2764714 RepID=A0ABR7J593_9FLAO|nr:hypothetical protein [Flavobacterium kayseriense]MBC5840719.1 hypothetical protein [Flavobacterium kayseriense]MBC5846611.1 hypothetical protein [Flavobacterium kayseriense]MBX9888695.1 hypothetical protein [Flavobacteriaceae bacterium]